MSKKKQTMTNTEAYEILSDYQHWRRGEAPYDWRVEPGKNAVLPYSPTIIGIALDAALAAMRKVIQDKADAPLCNKEVGSPNERGDRFHLFCKAFPNCKDCPYGESEIPEHCVMMWEDAPYEEEV